MKIAIKGVEARDRVIKGADFLADAVKSTLGPWGLNALLEKGHKVTNDGVTVSKEVSDALEDDVERWGAKTLHEAANRTNNEAGDGTTTAITLSQAVLKEALKYLPSGRSLIGKIPPAELIKRLKKESDEVISLLEAQATPITSEEQLIQSAKVSVEDDELGELIGKAQWKLGKDGVLIAEGTAERTSSIEFIKGIRIDNGYGTSLAINNQAKQTLEVKDIRVILTNHVIHGMKALGDLMDQMIKTGTREVAIIARAFDEEAIKVCQENVRNGFNVYPINAPYTDQNEIMKDLEVILGGRYISYEDTALEDVQLSDVGFASRIVASRYNAIFTGEDIPRVEVRIEERCKELENRKEKEPSQFEKNNLDRRIAQLKAGYGIVKIGATSDAEREYKLDKAVDAVNAVRAALNGGTVKGAGLAYKEIADKLPDTYILKRPLMAVYEQIRATAPSDWTVPDWVRDPLVVVRTALKNAVSVASTLATTNVVVVSERPKPIDTLLKRNMAEE